MEITEDSYGEVDGREGQKVFFIELDDTPEERKIIAEDLYDRFVSSVISGEEIVDYENGIEFQVDVQDYHKELLAMLEDDDSLDNEDKDSIKREVKEYYNSLKVKNEDKN